MKESITGRDLFVISTVCTGFGVLLAWGLFYRWGSAPPSKPIDWPAWAQAIGSIIAIAVAIAVPWSIHRAAEASDKRVEYLQATTIAGAFQPFISYYRGRANSLRKMLEQNYSEKQIAELVPKNAFDVAPTIQQFHPKLYMLGEAGIVASEFVANLFWMSLYMEILHKGHGGNARDQALIDCKNLIAVADELEPLINPFCRPRDRRVRK
ncbi:hypothetical protein [Stenotrophomonas acidaminiphila]|jgi:hypothetical protein